MSALAGMMATVVKAAGPLAGKTLNNALIDSYEVGSQNWTPKFREEFQRRRGYDPLPFLPTVTGRVVESTEASERFLWDLRRTVCDLFADNYFGYFGDLCHKNGLKFSTEPYGNGSFDDLQCGGRADIPMGEFWVGGAAMETTKLAASVGHTNGRQVIEAVYKTNPAPQNATVAPDLIVGYAPGYRASWQTGLGGTPALELEDNNDAWIADHCINPVDVPGVLFTSRGVSGAAARLQHVTSTVLRAFGIDGR